jgi:hypothetical protein
MAGDAVKGTLQNLVYAFSNSSPVVKAITVAVSVSVLFSLFRKQQKNILFPTWAVLEIAATSHLLPGGGTGRRI